MAEAGKITYASPAGDESVHAGYEEALTRMGGQLGITHPIHIGDREISGEPEFELHSPLDRRILIGRFRIARDEEIREAIQVARGACRSWDRAGARERTRIIRKAAGLLEEKKFLLSALMTYEVGKDRLEALAEAGEAVDMIRYYCDEFEKSDGFERPMTSAAPGERCESMMRPYGVFAVISPFNFPLALAAGMCTAALLTGNTVVFKPASASPLTGLHLYETFREAGVPGGVLHFLTGPGGEFGKVAVTHPHVDGIAFTGSRAAGMWLYRSFCTGSPWPKPLIAELGSKNPVIVTAKADLGKAAEGVARSAFGYCGQKCSAASRVYVDAAVASEFESLLIGRTREIICGDPRERGVGMGPLIDETALVKYRRAVKMSRDDGGSLLAGGDVLRGGIFDHGAYVSPAIVAGLPAGHPLDQEELFVPFLIIHPYSTLDEALALANSTDYGLTAGIFSEDSGEIGHFFEAIRSGVCYANRRGGATTGAWPGAQPFAGWKASGSTGKGVGGPYYLSSFLREQARTRVD
jgi:1-pyrroline-5-carboxylate dehydrogenase